MTAPDVDAAPVNWALYLAKHGLRIIPIRPRGKEPNLPDWPNRATTDPAAICQWFDEIPESNYGIATAGLVVVDIDPRHGGHLWFDDNLPSLPETWTFKTGGGGLHLIYRAPTGVELGNRAGIAPGVDIRANGGQIVGPGCVHPNGGLYEIQLGPDDVPLAECPAWLVDLIRQPAKAPEVNGQAVPANDLNSGPIIEGARDDTLTRIAGHLLRVFAVEQARKALHGINKNRCKNKAGNPAPLPEFDIDRIIDSIAKSEARKQRETAAPATPSAAQSNWGQFRPPSDLNDIEPPEYNIDGILQKCTTALLWGLPGCGKTTQALDWWARCALGRDWCGRSVKKGVSFYLPLEDSAGFRARKEAWEEHFGRELPPWALWWDGDFDFSDDCIAHVRAVMEEQQRQHGLPAIFVCLDPLMKVYGEGTALDEQDFRKCLTAIERLIGPFPEATALAIQHAGWDNKHELGSIMQRALTATSIKASAADNIVTLTVVRQKNDEEGITFTFAKHSLGSKGKLVLVPVKSEANVVASLTGQNRLAFDALVKAVDDANQAGASLPKLSEGLSERCPVDLWRREFERMKSDGSDTSSDSIRRTFDRAKGKLQSLKLIGFYNNFAWIDWKSSDISDKGSDK